MGELIDEKKFLNALIRKELGWVRIDIKEIILDDQLRGTGVVFTATLENKKGEDILKHPERTAYGGDAIRVQIP